MPKDTPKTKKERLAAVQHIINDIISWENFKVGKKIKFGPRYYITHGKINKQSAIFKICLYADSIDHLTNEKFSREILFLNFIQYSRFKKVETAAPSLFAFGLKPRAWYIRELINGNTQNIANGNVRFIKTFFNQANLDWTVKLLFDLQHISAKDLPNNFKKFLYPPDFTKHLWRFISPHWQRIEKYMKWPGVSKLIKKEFNKYTPIYNKAPRVLAHQEPYACHFIKTKQGLRLIDWENIGWANPNHDAVVLWMRAYKHPEWQKKLYYKFKRHYSYYKKFDDLWTIEVLIQAVFNVISYHFYNNKRDIIDMVKFSDKKIREILTDNFKFYN